MAQDTPESYYALFPFGKLVWEPDTRGRTPCQLTMYFWHVLFGERLWLPRRHRDPRLPLFARMLNIEAEAVLEAQRGEDGGGGALHFTHEGGSDETCAGEGDIDVSRRFRLRYDEIYIYIIINIYIFFCYTYAHIYIYYDVLEIDHTVNFVNSLCYT